MFIDLFGKQYKRNPNLIDTAYNFTECNYLHNIICHEEFTSDEFKYIVKPILNKLSVYDNCFLTSELKFIKQIMQKVCDEGFCQVYVNILNKTSSYLTDENIKANMDKAEL